MDSYPMKPAKKGKSGTKTSAPRISQRPRQVSRSVNDSVAQNSPSSAVPRNEQIVYKNNKITGGSNNTVQYGNTYHAGANHGAGGTVIIHALPDVPGLASLRKKGRKNVDEAIPTEMTSKSMVPAELKKLQLEFQRAKESYDTDPSQESKLKTVEKCNQIIQGLEALTPKLPKNGKPTYICSIVYSAAYHLRGTAQFLHTAELEERPRYDGFDNAIDSLLQAQNILLAIENSEDPYLKKRHIVQVTQLQWQAKIVKASVDALFTADLMEEGTDESLGKAMQRLNIAEDDMKKAVEGLEKLLKSKLLDENARNSIPASLNTAKDTLADLKDLENEIKNLMEDLSSSEDEDEDEDEDDSGSEDESEADDDDEDSDLEQLKAGVKATSLR